MSTEIPPETEAAFNRIAEMAFNMTPEETERFFKERTETIHTVFGCFTVFVNEFMPNNRIGVIDKGKLTIL